MWQRRRHIPEIRFQRMQVPDEDTSSNSTGNVVVELFMESAYNRKIQPNIRVLCSLTPPPSSSDSLPKQTLVHGRPGVRSYGDSMRAEALELQIQISKINKRPDSEEPRSFRYRNGFLQDTHDHMDLAEIWCVVFSCSQQLDRLTPSEQKFESIIQGFRDRWGFPQCGGAIDGTHIGILAPPVSSAGYYNWKGFYSVILQGVVDHRLMFWDINVGWPGKVHDARVFANSSLFERGQSNTLFPRITEV
ncbi:nuclease HARBI1 [Labeo rohita]|uniref:Nuclease HARBI1 n=1 Tax=Labeo rohita TaxID=84645 RepID=A0A498LQ96_LABRO|nr:nuclease HARBI1 [Labeo rohita]